MLAIMLLAAAGDAGVGVVSLADQSVLSETEAPSDALASYALTSAGEIQASDGLNSLWLTPQIGMNLFEVEAVIQSGGLHSGPSGAGLWSGLGTTRTWSVLRAGTGISSCVVRLRIRRASDLGIVATAVITLTATVGTGTPP